MEPHSLSLPNHADDPGLMKPPARIPSKANTRLVAEPGEPAALRHVKKKRKHAGDSSLLAVMPVLHAGHVWVVSQIQRFKHMQADMFNLWDGVCTRYHEQKCIASKMHPYITRACMAEKFHHNDEWTKLQKFLGGLDRLLPVFATLATQLDDMHVELESANASNQTLVTNTTSGSLLADSCDLYRQCTKYRAGLSLSVSACIEADKYYDMLKHACIYYMSKPSASDGGIIALQCTPPEHLPWPAVSEGDSNAIQCQSSKHQPMSIQCPDVGFQPAASIGCGVESLTRARATSSFHGNNQKLVWPAGTFAGKSWKSAVVDLDSDNSDGI